MAKLYILDYSFLFDDATPFGHVWEFEKLFADFLGSKGLQAEIIKAVEGNPSRRLMLIVKKDTSLQTQRSDQVVVVHNDVVKQGRPIMLKTKIKQLADRKLRAPAIKFMKGK